MQRDNAAAPASATAGTAVGEGGDQGTSDPSSDGDLEGDDGTGTSVGDLPVPSTTALQSRFAALRPDLVAANPPAPSATQRGVLLLRGLHCRADYSCAQSLAIASIRKFLGRHAQNIVNTHLVDEASGAGIAWVLMTSQEAARLALLELQASQLGAGDRYVEVFMMYDP